MLYFYEQYPESDYIDTMKEKFVKINEKATGFLFKNIVHGGLKKTIASAVKLDESAVKANKQSTNLWNLVNSKIS